MGRHLTIAAVSAATWLILNGIEASSPPLAYGLAGACLATVVAMVMRPAIKPVRGVMQITKDV